MEITRNKTLTLQRWDHDAKGNHDQWRNKIAWIYKTEGLKLWIKLLEDQMYNWKKSEGTSAILSILKFVLTSQTHAV